MASYLLKLAKNQSKSTSFRRKLDKGEHSLLLSKCSSSIEREEQRRFLSGSVPILITPVHQAKQFMKDCLLAVGTIPDNAEIVAHNLITADHRGYYSHGMNRLEHYIRDIQKCRTDATACPVLIKETVAIAHVDGKNALGAVTGTRCMEIAIKKAKTVGIGFVASKGGNHYGLASIYPLQAMQEDLIGFSVTNTSPLMCPVRAKKAALGTNPISLGANGLEGDSFVLDIATTAVSLGKIEFYKRKKQMIPPGWALNDEGKAETNPEVAYKAAKLMPLGGTEENSGYKGYGMAMLVEIFCGILAGSAYGPNIRKWGGDSSANTPANLGSAFMAIDPKAFEPCFEKRLQDLMCQLRNMEPVDPKRPVMVHGDVERNHMGQVEIDGGLRYVENQHKTMEKLAEELKVQLPCSEPLKQ